METALLVTSEPRFGPDAGGLKCIACGQAFGAAEHWWKITRHEDDGFSYSVGRHAPSCEIAKQWAEEARHDWLLGQVGAWRVSCEAAHPALDQL